MTRRQILGWVWVLSCCVILSGCRERREPSAHTPSYTEVEPLLEAACSKCHGGKQASAGYAVQPYLSAIGCTQDGRIVTEPRSARAPLIHVLGDATHRDLMDDEESELLTRWVGAGAGGKRGAVHRSGILDPRSPEWHGKLAAQDNWAALRSPDAEFVCGSCHDGSPVRPEGIGIALPSAPACTSCHTGAKAVLECATCHGRGTRSYPPRDPCYFEASVPDAHAAHLEGRHFRSEPLACATCHEAPDLPPFTGRHGDGKVDVRFDAALAGASAVYTTSDGTCSVGCHARGGSDPQPVFRRDSDRADGGPTSLDCNSCHQSPPPAHYPGTCNRCHSEMAAGSSALSAGKLHINGKVDLGNGNASCGACHGVKEDPWPSDAAHQAHRRSELMKEIECSSCHAVPSQLALTAHLDGKVEVAFSGQALLGGLMPSFDAVDRTCQNVSCHGASLAPAAISPRWDGTATGNLACGSCHGVPPPAPHVAASSCGGGLCHGAEVAQSSDGYAVSESGRARHIDGKVQIGL